LYLISVYKDDDNKIIIIPNARCEHGFRYNIDYPEVLTYPYTEGELGEKVKKACLSAVAHPFILEADTILVTEKVTGRKWLAFTRRHRCVWVRLNYDGAEYDARYEKGYEVEYMKRKKSSYGNLMSDPRFVENLPINATHQELGAAILRVFDRAVRHYQNWG
jgi:hypothetical protein